MNKMRISTKRNYKNEPTRILELKNTITELKNPIESFTIRLDQAEKRISELKDRSFEIIQSEEQKEKRAK